jgi:hypothetical protein
VAERAEETDLASFAGAKADAETRRVAAVVRAVESLVMLMVMSV